MAKTATPQDLMMHYVDLRQSGLSIDTGCRDQPVRAARAVRAKTDLLRGFDVVGASLLIVFLLPMLCLVAVAVCVTSTGPVVFAHARHGRGGILFDCLKFRTMVVDAEARLSDLLAMDLTARNEWALTHKLRNDPRVTWIGHLLRRSSLDELPQLWNVMRGDMSLVGPRPIVTTELVRYRHYVNYYYFVRPGMTGLWQVSGRSNISYRRRVAMDVVYARRECLALYLQILFMTFPSVLLSKGAA